MHQNPFQVIQPGGETSGCSSTPLPDVPVRSLEDTSLEGMKKFFIHTYGCQMNLYDSELVGSILMQAGYAPTRSVKDADLVLINTCAVRENAEQRVHGRIGELKPLKTDKPETIMGVLGCMAQRIGDDILDRAAHVDLVAGPDSYRKLPEMLARIESGEGQQHAMTLDNVESYSQVAETRSPGGLKAWLAVQRGCNYACTYCIVPYVRGRERYRPIPEVVKEVERLVSTGTKEVTILGQTVNAYRDGAQRFDALLRVCNEVAGIERIRYTTSHPLKMRTEMFEAMADCEHVCEFLHLPFQSGSERILQHMRRGYTYEEFASKIAEARSIVPGIAVATDVIVGYPTETEEDFQRTMDLVEEVEFDMVYNFTFSVRPGTPAEEFEDDVPNEVKKERLQRVIELSKTLAQRKNDKCIGTTQEVLVDAIAEKKSDRRLIGRTRTNKPVHFDGEESLMEEVVQVRITEAGPHSLLGDLVRQV
ncbi:MAG: tRNA (N6-isopentenyl adenosine(37)-C2)-methylthiotransferase MiaB [Planctomycetota bacterium]|nr:tRNA (N6-isopentenyl adenosine(37)-C2)-methylthiotransferase MiaB [Planctomycetota bacterium]MDP6503760.1 tRNA (N6-isopentenyl adenosine(37)-C2)-methylthiotransferase MiaB [Planctomycetota bacterium]